MGRTDAEEEEEPKMSRNTKSEKLREQMLLPLTDQGVQEGQVNNPIHSLRGWFSMKSQLKCSVVKLGILRSFFGIGGPILFLDFCFLVECFSDLFINVCVSVKDPRMR